MTWKWFIEELTLKKVNNDGVTKELGYITDARTEGSFSSAKSCKSVPPKDIFLHYFVISNGPNSMKFCDRRVYKCKLQDSK